MRAVMLAVTLTFIVLLAVLTGIDISRYGLTGVSVLALVVLVLFATGVLGALRHPPRG
ncbi:MAG TPA: hypothetical protein VLP43_01625 [Solirubrobacteraceae bacterium]|nr:hypothetical protein [Solirubrobacteraceae bacterium]